jgi:calcineurin-like phosphoesterase family protein
VIVELRHQVTMTSAVTGSMRVATVTLGILAASATTHAQTTDLPCEIDDAERVVAVADVHGAYDRFVEILKAAGVLDSRERWAGGRTHFVQIGDVVDRGPDSRKALDLLRRLQGEAQKAGGAVHALLGNHEVNRLVGDFRYVVPDEYRAFETRESADLRERVAAAVQPENREVVNAMPLGSIEMRQAFAPTGEYGEWLRTLKVVVKINGVVFVHGGLDPGSAALSCETMNQTARRELTDDWEKTQADPLHTLVGAGSQSATAGYPEDGPLFYRGLALQPDAFETQVDEVLAKQKARAIVVGHTLTSGDNRIRVRWGGKVLQLDTGMQSAYVPTGRASALEIRNGVFTAIYVDRRDVLVTQPAAATPETPQPAAAR